jgi:hypothetical protein
MVRGKGLAAGLAVAMVPTLAHADEPLRDDDPRLLDETSEVTTVVDAFDRGDPFDIHVFVGFEQRWKNAKIRRETALAQPGLSTGGFVAATENVASYSQATSLVHVGADVGLFRDLALIFRVPITVADSRELGDLDGSSKNPQRLLDPTGTPLFSVPFKSPNRGGVDYIAVGLNWAPLNQQRDRSKPTWLIGVELRGGVGTSLHACNATAGGMPYCPDPASPAVTSRDPGISRGMWGLYANTMISRRVSYVEPYTGFSLLAEFPQDRGNDFNVSNIYRGALLYRPPLVGTLSIGMEVIPWEHRENFQRLVIDTRIQGQYHSQGREYSELFDALGSSVAPTLRRPNPSAYVPGPGNSSIADPAAPSVYFSGITDQQAYGSLKGSIAITWQAGQFLKFSAGTAVQYDQSHVVTAAEPCNPNVDKLPGTSGPCRTPDGSQVTGIPNPNHRDVLDTPGRRFTVDDATIVSLWLNGTLMF